MLLCENSFAEVTSNSNLTPLCFNLHFGFACVAKGRTGHPFRQVARPGQAIAVLIVVAVCVCVLPPTQPFVCDRSVPNIALVPAGGSHLIAAAGSCPEWHDEEIGTLDKGGP